MNINTKYDVGQKLWTMLHNKPQEFTVETVEVSVNFNHADKKPYAPIEKYKLRIGESAGSRVEACDTDLDQNFFDTKEQLLKSL